MRKILLEVEVNDSDLDALDASLNKTEGNFKDVDQAAKKTSKSVDDVAGNGGAIAILDSLTGGLATRMRDAFEATKLFNISLKGTRTALIATGIGAFVVAVGLVVAYWDEIVDAVKRTNKQLENQLNLVRAISDTLEGELSLVDKQIGLQKLKGKNNEKLEKQRIAILNRLKSQNEAEIKILKNQISRLKSTSTELGFWDRINIQIQQALFGTEGLTDASADLAAQRLKEIKELESALLVAEGAAIDLDVTLFNSLNPKGDGEQAEEEGTPQALTPAQIAALEQARTLEDAKTQILQEGTEHRLDIQKQAVDASIEIARLEAEAKIAAAQGYATALAQISGAIGKETAAGKVLAIASAGISTYLSAQQAYQSQLSIPTPDAPIRAGLAAGAAVAAGLANIKRIVSVKVPNFGGGGSFSGGNSFGPSNIPSPEFNVVGDTGINQLQNTIEDGFGKATRSYVLFSDIQKANDIETNSIQESTV